jgi:hypothetical protein
VKTLKIRTWPKPHLIHEDDVIISVQAFGLNFADICSPITLFIVSHELIHIFSQWLEMENILTHLHFLLFLDMKWQEELSKLDLLSKI